MSEELITAEAARITLSTPSQGKIDVANKYIQEALKLKETNFTIPFSDIGDSEVDIVFLKHAGYSVYRNSSLLAWEIIITE